MKPSQSSAGSTPISSKRDGSYQMELLVLNFTMSA
jgi:hypothetical protein